MLQRTAGCTEEVGGGRGGKSRSRSCDISGSHQVGAVVVVRRDQLLSAFGRWSRQDFQMGWTWGGAEGEKGVIEESKAFGVRH